VLYMPERTRTLSRLALLGLVVLALVLWLVREERGAPASRPVSPNGDAALPPPSEHSSRSPTRITNGEPGGSIALTLHGCEGDVHLVASGSMDAHLAELDGGPAEVAASIHGEGAFLVGLAPVVYRVEVGTRVLGWVRADADREVAFVGSCRDDCALRIDLLADGCAEAARLTLVAATGEIVRTTDLGLGVGGATQLWSDLPCGLSGEVGIVADGCTPLREEVVLDESIEELRMVLPERGSFRVRAVDLDDGLPLAGSWVTWSRAGGRARFESGTWHGLEHVVVVEAPPGATLRIDAPDHVPGTFTPVADQGPDAVAEIALQTLVDIEVRCTLDDEPCTSGQVALASAWFVGQGPVEQEPCEPTDDPGTWTCPAAPRTAEANSPFVDGYVDRRWSGRVGYALPGVEPTVLALHTSECGGSVFCASPDPVQGEGCELWIPEPRGGVTNVLYAPGTAHQIDEGPGEAARLACPDGFAVVTSRASGCEDVALQPWGAVCVEHLPALACVLLDARLPIAATRVEGCNDRVPPGTWGVTCAMGEEDGALRWVDCDPVRVEAGETSEIRCW